MADNYLFLEELLIKRINDQVQGLKFVGSAPDIDAVKQQRQKVPAAYVIYLGDDIVSDVTHQGGNRVVQKLVQNWAIVLTVNQADSMANGAAARRQTGELLGSLIKKLTGWAPVEGVTPLKRAAGRSATFVIGSFLYYPLIFQTSFIFPKTEPWRPPQ